MDIQHGAHGTMRELALFAGAGGGLLGGHLLGWRTVCAVEIDRYAASVLVARQNDELLPPFPIWDDVCTFDGRPWRGRVDVVSGGFPCQDVSSAGRGGGVQRGTKSGLWKHMARIVGEVRPRYVFVENSSLLVSRGLDIVVGDLSALGYDAAWGIVSAQQVGAPHRRERIWIVAQDVADAGRGRRRTEPGRRVRAQEERERRRVQVRLVDAVMGEELKKNPRAEGQQTLASSAGGYLNPVWVEWLMGWPLGWTDLKPLAMDRFREWLSLHGGR